MAGYRRDRVNDQMTREMSEIVRLVKDPRVSGSFVSITASNVTPDYKFAKIYFSVMNKEEANEVRKGLESAAGFIRKQVAERMNLRITPEFTFVYDDSLDYGAGMEKLFKKIADERAARPATEEDSGEDAGNNGEKENS